MQCIQFTFRATPDLYSIPTALQRKHDRSSGVSTRRMHPTKAAPKTRHRALAIAYLRKTGYVV